MTLTRDQQILATLLRARNALRIQPDRDQAILELMDEIETELRKAGNPNHKGSGPGGGQFASGPGGGGGASAQHGKHWAKRQRKKKHKNKKSVTSTGGGKARDTRVKLRKPTPKPAAKDAVRGERAKQAYEAAKSNVHVQRYGEAQESHLIAKIGGTQGSNNGAVDVVRRIGGATHGLEVKTIINKGGPNKSGLKAQIKMMPDQRARKEAWVSQKPDRRSGVVVMDHRDRAKAADGSFIGNKEAYSGHDLYYRRDYGAHTLGGMYKVKSASELKSLMSKSDAELRIMVKSDKKYKGLIRDDK